MVLSPVLNFWESLGARPTNFSPTPCDKRFFHFASRATQPILHVPIVPFNTTFNHNCQLSIQQALAFNSIGSARQFAHTLSPYSTLGLETRGRPWDSAERDTILSHLRQSRYPTYTSTDDRVHPFLPVFAASTQGTRRRRKKREEQLRGSIDIKASPTKASERLLP